MKKVTAKTIRGLARVVASHYNSGFEVAVMKDCDGLYLLGFPYMSFPSSNNDECLLRLNNISSQQAILENIAWNIENGLDEKSILGKYRLF